MTCWICKRTEDDFKSLNEKALSELKNALQKLGKGLSEINERLIEIGTDEEKKKHLETAKGHLKHKIKKLNYYNKILKGEYYDYCISDSDGIEVRLANSAKRFLSESFAEDYILAPLKINTTVKVCCYCRNLMYNMSYDSDNHKKVTQVIVDMMQYIEENIEKLK